MTITDYIQFTRWINLILIFLGEIGCIFFYIKYKEPSFIAPILWLINVSGFYVFRLSVMGHQTKLAIDLINLWSSVIIGHAAILIICVLWLFFIRKAYHSM